jgi:hypothetical protein
VVFKLLAVGIMKIKGYSSALSVLLLIAFALSSCDTPVGAGAGYGAAAGAIIGGAATGHTRGAAIGAASGAAAGALIGAAIQEDRTRYQYARYPYARPTGTPGLYRSPYTGRTYDLTRVPPGGLTRDADTGEFFRRPYA